MFFNSFYLNIWLYKLTFGLQYWRYDLLFLFLLWGFESFSPHFKFFRLFMSLLIRVWLDCNEWEISAKLVHFEGSNSACECDALALCSFGITFLEYPDEFFNTSGDARILRIFGSGANT
jgi:hypothetical protein